MALIIDTGPIYSALDRTDNDFAACVDLLSSERILIVPAPVLVEVDYLVRTRLHNVAHSAFLGDIVNGAYKVEELTPSDYERIRELCEKYSDLDLGLVDAAVVTVAERLNERRIATLDQRAFRVIRPRHVDAFELLPDLK